MASTNNRKDVMQATEDKTYNGWKNYETWAVGMYLDGNYDGEGTYRDVLMRVEDIYEDITEPTSVWTVEEARKFNTADMLKDYVAEMMPAGGLAGDLIGAALSEVDWDELAEHKLQEVSESR